MKAIVRLEDIIALQNEIVNVRINPSVSRYVAQIAKESRKDKNVALGISPRGSLYLVRAAKAWAYYNGRDYVIPDDIKYMLLPVCAHRITPRAEAKYENLTHVDILTAILKKATVPKGDFDGNELGVSNYGGSTLGGDNLGGDLNE
jgi:MoxR-like ATPase